MNLSIPILGLRWESILAMRKQIANSLNRLIAEAAAMVKLSMEMIFAHLGKIIPLIPGSFEWRD